MAILDTIKSAAEFSVNRTSELLETAKINFAIKSKEDDLSNLYQEIGRRYYEQKTERTETDGDYFIRLFSKADAAQSAIAELKSRLAIIKDTRTCPICGAESVKENAFCSHCGTPLRSGAGNGFGAGSRAGRASRAGHPGSGTIVQDVEYRASGEEPPHSDSDVSSSENPGADGTADP